MDFVGSAGSDYRKAEAEGKAGLKMHSTLPLRIIGNDKPRSTNFGHDLVRNSTDKLFGINAQRSVTGRSYRWLKAVRPRSDECRVKRHCYETLRRRFRRFFCNCSAASNPFTVRGMGRRSGSTKFHEAS